MNGYIKNKTSLWRHAMKREIGPGKIVSLDDIYEQYGEKHGLEKGKPFVEWLKQIKLKDTNIWQVVYNKDGGKVKKEPKKLEEKHSVAEELVVPHVKEEQTVDGIANLSVRVAREEIPKMTDLKLLKYALQTANQLANKDTLCRI
jgi:alkylated DNA nucleotide flippase Atl1